MQRIPTSMSIALLACMAACAARPAPTFATPEEAVRRLAAAVDDPVAAEELLGPGEFSLLISGDEVADRADVVAVRKAIDEKLAFEDVGDDCKLALLGADAFELPIPLVRDDAGRWRFDVAAGREEVVNRRVGRNELSAIATLRELVEGQREYAAESRDGNPPAFAERLLSSAGRHDGLYWPAAEGEPESPLGELVAQAFHEGYRKDKDSTARVPYHGYYFRLLFEQGPQAPGGKRAYRDAAGRLTGGFAFVAWPASYRDSGAVTFLVNRQGIVFQKDLGEKTEDLASSMTTYDLDATWVPVVD